MTPAASFKEYYSRPTTGAGGDNNVDAFNDAMNSETDQRDAARAFNNADGTFFYAYDKKIRVIHGLVEFGNTMSNPNSKVGGHMGMLTVAFIGLVDVVEALSISSFDTPKGEELSNCTTMAAFRELQPEDNAGSFVGPKVFFPAPFVQRAVVRSGSFCPTELIFKVREEYTEFIVGKTPSDVESIDAHMSFFEQYLWGVLNGKFTSGTIFTPNADDIELSNFSTGYHASRINPVISTTTTSGAVPTGGVSLGSVNVLTETLTRIVEEQGSSAEILERMHTFAMSKEEEKKERSVKWHPSTIKLVLLAASGDGIKPASLIPPAYRRIINAESLGHADIDLTEQMRTLGHEEVEWDLQFTNSLRHGIILYEKSDTPSNLTIFALRVKNPMALNEQQSRGMNLHILEAGKENSKSILEMIRANKKPIKLPTIVEELIVLVRGFGGIATILFGKSSSLAYSLVQLGRELSTNKLRLKAGIANDSTLIAKILYTIDTRAQLWASYLQQAVDREDVSDTVLDFNPMMNDVVLGQLHVILPVTFTSPKVAIDDEPEDSYPKKKKKKGSPAGEDEKKKTVINKNVPVELRLREGESYKKVLAGRCLGDRPEWNETCTMCTRWWTHGVCYSDCKNAASHVPSSELPAPKKAAFIEFLEIARRA